MEQILDFNSDLKTDFGVDFDTTNFIIYTSIFKHIRFKNQFYKYLMINLVLNINQVSNISQALKIDFEQDVI